MSRRRNILHSGGGAERIDINNYLTMVALADGMTASLSTNACDYCIDGEGNWTTLAAGESTPSVKMGQTISFRATGLTPDTTNGIGTFSVSANYNLIGNVMSMVYGDEAEGQTAIPNTYQFYGLFNGSTTLKSVSEDFLPATTLTTNCYERMFYECTALTSVPSLPATTLASTCYQNMFRECSALVTVPSDLLPATTLKARCYAGMFYGCKKLTSVITLPATKLTERCYYLMFCNCTSLTTAPTLSATTLAIHCYRFMFQGCSKLTTPPSLPAKTMANYCYCGMFYGCGFTTAPALPATILASYCYQYMFQNCTKLTTAPALPSTSLEPYCYSYMFYGCTSLTKAPDLLSTGFATYCYEDMFYGCSKLSYIKAMFILTPNSSYTSSWVYGVASTGTFVKNSAAEWDVTGADGVPSGWTVLDENGNAWTPPAKYTVDLNDQWQLSTAVSNPDEDTYEGVYESFSNYNVDSTGAFMYITIKGYETFQLYIRSYAESNYDYVMVSQLDQTITNDTSYSNTTLVKAHTRGSQSSGTAISNYKLVEFTGIDGGEHTITIVYRKDSSAESGTDKGYVLIPKNQ